MGETMTYEKRRVDIQYTDRKNIRRQVEGKAS